MRACQLSNFQNTSRNSWNISSRKANRFTRLRLWRDCGLIKSPDMGFDRYCQFIVSFFTLFTRVFFDETNLTFESSRKPTSWLKWWHLNTASIPSFAGSRSLIKAFEETLEKPNFEVRVDHSSAAELMRATVTELISATSRSLTFSSKNSPNKNWIQFINKYLYLR